jgi:hypothetical protein
VVYFLADAIAVPYMFFRSMGIPDDEITLRSSVGQLCAAGVNSSILPAPPLFFFSIAEARNVDNGLARLRHLRHSHVELWPRSR